jgi:hypothetical protein
MSTLEGYTGVDQELVAYACAMAMATSRKFGAAEHRIALDFVQKHSTPANLVANVTRLGNLSAVRQEHEKAGVLPMGDASALARAVRELIGTHVAPKALPEWKIPEKPKK